MQTLRLLSRLIAVMAGVVAALALFWFGTSPAGATTPAGRTIPGVVGSLPGGGNVGDVITTTCGDSPVIVLSVIVCQLELPAPTG
jgi:hypothetical protein